MLAGREVDEAVNDFSEAIGISTNAIRSFDQRSSEMRRHQLIDENTARLLNDLRQIRNDVVRNINEPTIDEALRYQELAGRLVRQFKIATGAARMPGGGPVGPSQ
jgi:uncharacterized protein YutE (UPF0331/DUF86 family)